MTAQRITSKDIPGVKKVNSKTARGLESGECLRCGQILIHPYNDFHMCSTCTEWMHKQQYEFRQKVWRKGRKKLGGQVVVNKLNIAKQMAPRGQPTDKIG